MKKKEVWIDNVKVIACILVVLGHFFQSMVKANIIPNSDLYKWFNQTIYYFHVPLFFICSGYLYQMFSKVYNAKGWESNVVKKALNLGIPYFTFSITTLVFKKLFESAVNTTEGGFFTTLLINPTAPYWYLYVLFFIFLITPTFKSKKKIICFLVIALSMKLLKIIVGGDGGVPYAINGILENEIWFVLGMCINMLEWTKKLNLKTSLLGVVFLILSVYVYFFNISIKGMSFFLGMMACISIISIIYCIFRGNSQKKVFRIIAKYNLPIFLMHTIFAAGFRGILMKLGITSEIIHISLGLTASFICPIIAAYIMSKIIFLDIFLYPSKYIGSVVNH